MSNSIRQDETCPTRLVSDQPADRDKFGPHHGIANAIIGMIRGETGGRSIGISGKWGAGKSTVIRLLKADLSKRENEVIWIFDAWAHDGDPLRRTFLESLIARLCDAEWIDRKEWTKSIEVLARKRKTSQQYSTPRLSGFGFILASTLLLTPIGSALVSAGAKNGLTLFGPNTGPSWLFIIGLLLTASPIVGIGARCAYEWLKYFRRVRKIKHDSPPDLKAAIERVKKPYLQDLLALIVTKAVTKTKTETIETPDPTSIEFEQLFEDLMHEALRVSARRLVLVIDNLDRIDAHDAIRIWSTLQTFLQHATTDANWILRLWVIMPFDPDGIKKIWEQAGVDDGKLASSFLDKSFQVIFDVPEPLTSDWRDYLITQLQDALPNHSEEEFHIIYRTFSSLRGAQYAPTPREIKIVVNQIGALHRQRGHEIPLIHMAYYAVLCRNSTPAQIRQSLHQGTIPVQNDIGLLGADVRDSVASLLFGVEPKRAAQLLLEPSVMSALTEGDANKLRDIQQRTDGLPVVLESAVVRAATELPSNEGEKLLCALATLDESGFLDDSTFRPNVLLNELYQGSKKIDKLSAPIPGAANGIIALAKRRQDSDITRKLFNLFGNAVVGDKEVPNDKVAEIVSSIVTLANGLTDQGFSEATADGVTLNGPMETYIRAMRAIAALEPSIPHDSAAWHLFRPGIPYDQIADFFQAIFSQGKARIEHSFALQTIDIQQDDKWASVVSAARDRLRAENNIPPSEVNALLSCLGQFGTTAGAESAIKVIVNEGHLSHHIAHATEQKDMLVTAKCIAVFGTIGSVERNGHVGRSEEGDNLLNTYLSSPEEPLVQAFARLLINQHQESMTIQLLDKLGFRILAAKTIVSFVQDDSLHDGRNFITPDLVAEKWLLLKDQIEKSVFLQHIDENGRLRAILKGRGFESTLTSLYYSIIEGHPADHEFQAWCANGLHSISRDTWISQLSDGGDILDLLIICKKSGTDPRMGQTLSDAIRDYAKDVAAGIQTSTSDIEQWSSILSCLGPDEHTVLADELYDVLEKGEGRTAAPFFDIFGSEIAKSKAWENSWGIVIRVLKPILETSNQAGLGWVAQLLADGTEIFGTAIEEHIRTYKRALSDSISDDSQETNPMVAEIASRLGIQPMIVEDNGESDAESDPLAVSNDGPNENIDEDPQ